MNYHEFNQLLSRLRFNPQYEAYKKMTIIDFLKEFKKVH